jgi:hypothetical protein
MSRFVLVGLFTLACALPSGAQPQDPVVKFNYRRLDLREVDGHWWLLDGERPFKDLGTNENDAREALRVIHDLRLTHYCTVGSPEPIIEYWLSDGKAPQPFVHNFRLMPFTPEALRVEVVQGQWCICDGGRVMFGFGEHSEDARQTLFLLRHYGFNRVGYIGSPRPVMMYFVVSHEPAPVAKDRQPQAPPKIPAPLELMLSGAQLHVPSLRQNARDRIAFDCSRVEVRNEGNDWKLMAGDQCLVNFGIHAEEAGEALRLVQFYRLSEQCHIGSEGSGLTYYLANGRPPRGLMLGVRAVEFCADRLAIGQRVDGYYLCIGSQPVIAAGKDFEEAQQILQIIQRYEFDHICEIGSPEQPTMTILVQDH